MELIKFNKLKLHAKQININEININIKECAMQAYVDDTYVL